MFGCLRIMWVVENVKRLVIFVIFCFWYFYMFFVLGYLDSLVWYCIIDIMWDCDLYDGVLGIVLVDVVVFVRK